MDRPDKSWAVLVKIACQIFFTLCVALCSIKRDYALTEKVIER